MQVIFDYHKPFDPSKPIRIVDEILHFAGTHVKIYGRDDEMALCRCVAMHNLPLSDAAASYVVCCSWRLTKYH